MAAATAICSLSFSATEQADLERLQHLRTPVDFLSGKLAVQYRERPRRKVGGIRWRVHGGRQHAASQSRAPGAISPDWRERVMECLCVESPLMRRGVSFSLVPHVHVTSELPHLIT